MNPNQGQPPFQMMPMQMPMVIQGHGPDVDPMPPRMRVAMDFLALLTAKTMTRVAVNGMSIEQIPGQQLTKAELVTQATMCHELGEYVAGKTSMDDRPEGFGGAPGRPGIVIRCPACCPNPARPNCNICSGTGEVIVFPTCG